MSIFLSSIQSTLNGEGTYRTRIDFFSQEYDSQECDGGGGADGSDGVGGDSSGNGSGEGGMVVVVTVYET